MLKVEEITKIKQLTTVHDFIDSSIVKQLIRTIEELQGENNALEGHNDIFFKMIKKQINEFESVPLSEEGTHNLIVRGDSLSGLKQVLIEKGYEF